MDPEMSHERVYGPERERLLDASLEDHAILSYDFWKIMRPYGDDVEPPFSPDEEWLGRTDLARFDAAAFDDPGLTRPPFWDWFGPGAC